MKAIFWKEIRENVKWAAIGFVAFSLGLALAWAGVSDSNNYEGFISILSSSILMVTTLCGCGFGAALGFLQILPEQRRDRWAFLVHRPVPWQVIFRGKVMAGLCLYFAATLIPWVFLCYWASIPGHVAGPFDWRMSLAGLADILSGTAFYFAGMITSLRQARWFGSKAFALTGAIWALLASQDSAHFWAACAWIAVMDAALVVSARENFLRNGVYTSQRLFARVLLIAVFILGLCLVFEGTARFSQGMVYNGYTYGNAVSYGISKEGEPLKFYSKGGQLVRVEDIDGNDLHVSRELLPGYENGLPRAGTMGITDHRPSEGEYRGISRYMDECYQLPGTRWFYFHAGRRFEAYDHDTRKLTGYLAPDGYHAVSDGVPASTFPDEFQRNWPGYYFSYIAIFGTRVYLIDYNSLTVHQLAEAENPSDLRGAAWLSTEERYAAPLANSFVAAGLKDGITLFKSSDGSQQCHVAYDSPYADDKNASISAAITPDKLHFIIWYDPGFDMALAVGHQLPSYFYRYSIDGTLEKKWVLPPLFESVGKPPWTLHLWAVGQATGRQLYDAGLLWVKKQSGDPQAAYLWEYRFVRNWGFEMWDWVVAALTGFVCAIAAVVRCKSYRLRAGEIAGWAVFAFLGGIAGLLVLLAVKEWPARVACPNCAQKRMVNTDTCEHCSEPWKKPQPDGTEIFA